MKKLIETTTIGKWAKRYANDYDEYKDYISWMSGETQKNGKVVYTNPKGGVVEVIPTMPIREDTSLSACEETECDVYSITIG